MIALEIRFTSSRYHATAWGHHVNEATLDWPPSPWRILRGLMATWYLKARDQLDETVVRGLIEAMAMSGPVYALPRASAGHTRHYMPQFKTKTAKVFDAFLHLADAPLIVCWPELSLGRSHRDALGLLASQMGYLGRAESWVEARLLESWDGEPNARPITEGQQPTGEPVRLLAPLSAEDYQRFRAQWIEAQRERALAAARLKALSRGKPVEKVKLSAAALEKIEARLPSDLFGALRADTSDLQKAGWSQPPGSEWVSYSRPRDSITTAPLRRRAKVEVARPRVARYAVASQAPPRLTEALLVCEQVHRTLIAKTDGATVFTGRAQNGEPLSNDHQHAHIFCESYGRFGRVTHISIYAPMGFDEAARSRLEELCHIRRERHDLQLVLMGMGQPEDIGGANHRTGASPLFHRASRWRSLTPFISTRHPKNTRAGQPRIDPSNGLQRGCPEHDLRRLMALQGLPEPVSVTPIEAAEIDGGRSVRWSHFKTHRRSGKGQRGPLAGMGFEVTFDEPVCGPLALGFGRHFGLGLFEPQGT